MKNPPYRAGFSLVEVTLALAIAGFCLLTLFSLLSIGIQTHDSAVSQMVAASIVGKIVADLRATPRTSQTSSQYQITFGTEKLLYVDDTERVVNPNGSGAPPRCRVLVLFPPTSPAPFSPTFVSLKVSWPALADPTTNSQFGSLEAFVALNRY